jgi:putative ABC transport system permease protein
MLKNYLKIAFRNLVKHKGYSFINITGLAIGIACCLLIFLFVKDELTFDQFHKKGDRIFRLTTQIDFGGQMMNLGATSYPEGAAYLASIPEIDALVRFDNDAAIVKNGDAFVAQTGLVYTDPAIFEVFDLEVIEGTSDGALSELSNIVLTKRMAIKYFGKTDVVGESIQMNVETDLETFIVSAVINNHPSNSSFTFEMMLSWDKKLSQLSDYQRTQWGNIGINTFLLISGAPETIVSKIVDVKETQNPGEDGEFTRGMVSGLQPLIDIHLNKDLRGGDGLGNSGDASYSYILSAIALVILILACINFTNLSVARSLPRAKEIGVRKVLGAHRKQLAIQFLNEALLMCLIAFVFALLLAELALPVFGTLLEKTFTSGVTSDFGLIISCLILVLFTAFLSGFYPSFIISKFNTVVSLKGKVKLKGNSLVSKSLVVVQFTLAAILIVGTIAMNRQIDYMVNMDLGYDDENLISINANRSGTSNLTQLFKDELSQNPNIEIVSGANSYGSIQALEYEGEEFFSVFNDIDDRYLEMKDLEILSGRGLKKKEDLYITAEDTLYNILVNETFVKELDLQKPLNTVIGSNRIVGVVKDYSYGSAKSKVGKLTLFPSDGAGENEFESIYVKFNPVFLPQIQTLLETTWRKFVPYKPYESEFVKEANAASYEDESRWRMIITYASGLAIAISILGLFGLAHLSTQQRVKEIGIRKVLGASIAQIVLMLNSNFARLVLISIILASPLAYYLVDNWLNNFANKITISAWLFVIPGLITFGVAFLTVSLQSIKSAISNPVDSLRCE